MPEYRTEQMIIKHDDGRREHWMCPSNLHQKLEVFAQADGERTIPEYYSFTHAKDDGWIFTKDKKFSMRGDMVAVCPKCVKYLETTEGITWEEKR